MVKRISLIILVALLLFSCDLKFDFNTEAPKRGKVHIIVYGNRYDSDGQTYFPNSSNTSSTSTLNGTTNDAVQMANVYKAYCENNNYEYDIKYFLGGTNYNKCGSSPNTSTIIGLPESSEISQDTYFSDFTNYINSLQIADNDLTLLFISGHGYCTDDSIVEYGTDLSETGYFVFTQNKKNTSTVDANNKMVSAKELNQFLDSVPGVKFLVIDTCYSGSLIEPNSVSVDTQAYDSTIFNALYIDNEINPSKFILTGGRYYQETWELYPSKHGYITNLILEYFNWDEETQTVTEFRNNVTTMSLYSYLFDNWAIGTDKDQNPMITNTSADIIIFD